MIYLLTAIGLTSGGSSTVNIYTQTVHRTTQNKQYIEQHNNLGEYGPCPVLASYTLAFALQLRKKHGKTSVRVEDSATDKTSVRVEDSATDRFAARTSVFPCHYHSDNAPQSSSATCRFYQKDDGAKPANLQKAMLFR